MKEVIERNAYMFNYNDSSLRLIRKFQMHETWIFSNGTQGKRLTLINTSLRGLNLSNKKLGFAKFVNCTFDEASLDGTDIRECLFVECTFVNTKVNNTQLSGAKFLDCTSNGTVAYIDPGLTVVSRDNLPTQGPTPWTR